MANCTECGAWLDPAKNICPQCGREIARSNPSSENPGAPTQPPAGKARIHRISGSTKYLLRGMKPVNGKKIATLDELHHLYAHHETILAETRSNLTRHFDEKISRLGEEESQLSKNLDEAIAQKTVEVDRSIDELDLLCNVAEGFLTRSKYRIHYWIAVILRNHHIHAPFSATAHDLQNVRYEKNNKINEKPRTIERECRNITISYEFVKSNESFLIGADGEEHVIGVLSGLPEGYHVVNDVNLHFERAIHWRERDEWIKNSQIDHIVVGPTGVFLLETKNWKSSDIETKWDKLRYQVRRSSLALWYYLKEEYWGGKPPRVRSVIVSMKGNPGGRRPDKYIDIVSPHRLCRYILERENQLTEKEIIEVVRVLAR